MSNVGKSLSILFILLLAASSLIMAKPAFAQTSTPTPFVPTFTLNYIHTYYNVTTTDPYTGVSDTQQYDNNTILVTIKNQPFAYSTNGITYQLYYDVRTKPHFGQSWSEIYPSFNDTSDANLDIAEYIPSDSPSESNSAYTVLSFSSYYPSYPPNIGTIYPLLLPPNAQVDFQVQAVVGHNSTRYVPNDDMGIVPVGGGYYEPAVAYDTSSSWSNTQTITIATTSTSASPSPTSTSTSTPTVPELPYCTLSILVIFGAITVIALVFKKVGHLFYFTEEIAPKALSQ